MKIIDMLTLAKIRFIFPKTVKSCIIKVKFAYISLKIEYLTE